MRSYHDLAERKGDPLPQLVRGGHGLQPPGIINQSTGVESRGIGGDVGQSDGQMMGGRQVELIADPTQVAQGLHAGDFGLIRAESSLYEEASSRVRDGMVVGPRRRGRRGREGLRPVG